MPVRSKFMVHRAGASAAAPTLSPGFLTIYGRAIGPLTAGNAGSALTSGHIDFARGQDLKMRDFLKDLTTGRCFQITQIADMPAHRRALVREILGPIPDEFSPQTSATSANNWWTIVEPGDSNFSSVNSSGQMWLDGGPAASTPKNAGYLYQSVAHEFDIWSKVQVLITAGSGIQFALIGARLSSGEGVTVGIKYNNSTLVASFVRQEFHDSASVSERIASGAGLLAGYVRLSRRGSFFHTYYSTSLTEPENDHEWTEIRTAIGIPITLETVEVGCFGYYDSAAAGTLAWDFFRNWESR